MKRIVRQECRFGCVLCGSAIYDYHHIEPFKDVRDHNPADIVLLCGTCHTLSHRDQVGKERLRAERLNPYRLSHRWPHSSFYPNARSFPVILGGAEFIDPRTVLRIFGRDLLSIREPEREDGPIRISAELYDTRGKKCLFIEENECSFNPYSWDIETSGSCITIRTARKSVALRVQLFHDRLVVTRLAMHYCGVRLDANKRELKVASTTAKNWRLSGWVRSPDVGIEIIRQTHAACIEIPESKRTMNILGTGGDYRITGRQPPNTEIKFWGGARKLVMDADATMTVGGAPPTPNLGIALAKRAANSLSLDDLEILIGASARASSVSYK